MDYALKATEARRNYSYVLEEAVRTRPQVIRKLRDTVYWISAKHLETMLAPCRLTLRVRQEPDGSCYGAFDELDIMDSGKNLNDLKHNLTMALQEYAQSYMTDFQLYYNSLNRHQHLLQYSQAYFNTIKNGGRWNEDGRGRRRFETARLKGASPGAPLPF